MIHYKAKTTLKDRQYLDSHNLQDPKRDLSIFHFYLEAVYSFQLSHFSIQDISQRSTQRFRNDF